MSKTLDSGCSKKKTIRPYRKCKKRLGFFNRIFFSLRKKGKNMFKKVEKSLVKKRNKPEKS
jgi:hypothetical protein